MITAQARHTDLRLCIIKFALNVCEILIRDASILQCSGHSSCCKCEFLGHQVSSRRKERDMATLEGAGECWPGYLMSLPCVSWLICHCLFMNGWDAEIGII